MKPYRSPYEAYPFLSEDDDDLRCDFEILTDKIASETGLLASLCPEYHGELLRIEELVYHANPTLRTRFTVTADEVEWLKARTESLAEETRGRCDRFVLPAGTTRACLAHVLRTECKSLIRMTYRHAGRTNKTDEALIDFLSLLSGYFFMLAMRLNLCDGVDEIPFESRNYPMK